MARPAASFSRVAGSASAWRSYWRSPSSLTVRSAIGIGDVTFGPTPRQSLAVTGSGKQSRRDAAPNEEQTDQALSHLRAARINRPLQSLDNAVHGSYYEQDKEHLPQAIERYKQVLHLTQTTPCPLRGSAVPALTNMAAVYRILGIRQTLMSPQMRPRANPPSTCRRTPNAHRINKAICRKQYACKSICVPPEQTRLSTPCRCKAPHCSTRRIAPSCGAPYQLQHQLSSVGVFCFVPLQGAPPQVEPDEGKEQDYDQQRSVDPILRVR